jgi:hypothetical protein
VIVRILEHFIWQELVKFTLIGAALVDFVWQLPLNVVGDFRTSYFF